MQANAPDPLAAPRLTPDIVSTRKENLSNEISDCEQSLFLQNPSGRTQNKSVRERDCRRDVRAAIPRAARSAGVARHVHSHDHTLTCFAFSQRTALVDLSISFDLLADHEDLFYTNKVE